MKLKCVYCGGIIPKEILEQPSVKSGSVAPLYDKPECRRRVHRIKDAISLLRREMPWIKGNLESFEITISLKEGPN